MFPTLRPLSFPFARYHYPGLFSISLQRRNINISTENELKEQKNNGIILFI